jgi:hypothetical protein
MYCTPYFTDLLRYRLPANTVAILTDGYIVDLCSTKEGPQGSWSLAGNGSSYIVLVLVLILMLVDHFSLCNTQILLVVHHVYRRRKLVGMLPSIE